MKSTYLQGPNNYRAVADRFAETRPLRRESLFRAQNLQIQHTLWYSYLVKFQGPPSGTVPKKRESDTGGGDSRGVLEGAEARARNQARLEQPDMTFQPDKINFRG